jgi:hypothetical protein
MREMATSRGMLTMAMAVTNVTRSVPIATVGQKAPQLAGRIISVTEQINERGYQVSVDFERV